MNLYALMKKFIVLLLNSQITDIFMTRYCYRNNNMERS